MAIILVETHAPSACLVDPLPINPLSIVNDTIPRGCHWPASEERPLTMEDAIVDKNFRHGSGVLLEYPVLYPCSLVNIFLAMKALI